MSDENVANAARRQALGTMGIAVAGLAGSEIQSNQLGLWAVGWVLPRELRFSRVVIEPRLDWLLEAYETWLRRFKAVFRTGRGPSWLIQSRGRGVRGRLEARLIGDRRHRIKLKGLIRVELEFHRFGLRPSGISRRPSS